VKTLVGGVLSMPQVRKSGTAWERRLDDYAYTKGLDGPGWAWEFLRRSDKFLIEYRSSRAGLPVEIKHASGAIYLRPRRKFLRAETWGLMLFPNPKKSANETPVFWHPGTLTHSVNATVLHANDNAGETISLNDFVCQRVVLVKNRTEHVIVRSAQESVRLRLMGESILFGKCKCIFHVEGLSKVANVAESLRILTNLRDQTTSIISHQSQFELHLRDYLVALDGHLAGRSYRDIAEVIYGSDRVKNVWTNETRFLKEAVRRAVRRGIQYMESEYLNLL
jgi:hypothetical protein